MPPRFSETDTRYMARAIQLARRGLYSCDPNPRVGCVLVKEGQIVGEGWHQRAGQGHAEVVALQNAGDAALGAKAYVSLEPCCHQGKTPPCSDALVRAGIVEVVAAMQDPNPLVSGQGLAYLRKAGVTVSNGLLQRQAEALNPGFCKRMRTGLPWVFSKLAMSLDGRTAMASGESKWITGEHARQDVHRLRASSSAIVTGIETVLADDPSLTARLPESNEREVLQPVRVVIDSQLRMPLDGKLSGLSGRTLIFTVCENERKQQQLVDTGFEVFVLAATPDHRVDITALMGQLGRLGFNQVMIEAGPTLNGALLQAGMLDEWVIYQAPCILGDGGRGLFHLPHLSAMSERIQLQLLDARRMGNDMRFRLGRAK